MKNQKRTAEALLYTDRGKRWLAQFDERDKEIAEKVITSLTLVSHSEFEHVIQVSLEKLASENEPPIAFYAVREVDKQKSYFESYTDPSTGAIAALVPGSDHGSEARIAATIRNFCKTDSEGLLNHPSLSELREKKCCTVVFIDDFIGSGTRTYDFIASFWRDRTFVSWLSLKYLKTIIVAYSGTDRGIERVSRHKANPEVSIERSCPTFRDMPWGRGLRNSVFALCKRYGQRTNKERWWDGYGHQLVALVFEYGCPNNAPAILWAPDTATRPWQPLFPNRVVLAGEQSAFPPEIARGDSLVTLLDVGQKKLAHSGKLSRRGETGELILLILALIAKGQRKQSALSFATGLNREACTKVIKRCIKWGFLTQSIRLTVLGRAELASAKEHGKVYDGALERGDEHYFPQRLRRAARG